MRIVNSPFAGLAVGVDRLLDPIFDSVRTYEMGVSVGSDEFTALSRILEGATRTVVQSQVDASLAALRGLTARVVLPEEQPDPKAARA